MSCYACGSGAEYSCSCEWIFLCSEHALPHFNHLGNHKCEPLDLTLDEFEVQVLGKRAIDSVKRLKKSKLKILSLTNRMINKIESLSHSVLSQLDGFIRMSLALIATNKLSNSLRRYSEGPMSLTLNDEVNFEDFELVLKNFLNKDLNFINTDKEIFRVVREIPYFQYEIIAEKNIIDNSIEEAGFGDCIKFELQGETEVEGNEIILSNQGSNLWKLEKKKKFLESLRIEDYQEIFGRGNYFRELIKDIKFTDDSKYSFICQNYLGNSNEDFNELEKCTLNCEKICPDNLAIINLHIKNIEWSKSDWELGALEECRIWFQRYPNCFTRCGNFRF